MKDLLPDDASLVLLGDGEFDSIELQTFVADAGWEYVCRTAKNTQVCQEGVWTSLEIVSLGLTVVVHFMMSVYPASLRSCPGDSLVGGNAKTPFIWYPTYCSWKKPVVLIASVCELKPSF